MPWSIPPVEVARLIVCVVSRNTDVQKRLRCPRAMTSTVMVRLSWRVSNCEHREHELGPVGIHRPGRQCPTAHAGFSATATVFWARKASVMVVRAAWAPVDRASATVISAGKLQRILKKDGTESEVSS